MDQIKANLEELAVFDATAKNVLLYGYEKARERFFLKLKKTETCWNYNSSKATSGYSAQSFRIENKTKSVVAHRLSWLMHGKKGHELSGWNVMTHSKRPGNRLCRKCHYERLEKRKERILSNGS